MSALAPELVKLLNDLESGLEGLTFAPPVTHHYNALSYAREPFENYLRLYGSRPKQVLIFGMNPGPWGMAQTGIPFGEVAAVRDWMGVTGKVGKPMNEHPKRVVDGFACTRSEVSGRRLWAWAAERFGSAEAFFAEALVINYCPLFFAEESGRNRTPDRLKKAERERVFAPCDRAMSRYVDYFQPRLVVGVGKFAATRAKLVLKGRDIPVTQIMHPSPANPHANRGWSERVSQTLCDAGWAVPTSGTSGA